MNRTLQDVLRVASHELADSIRSRRAVLLLVLYLLGSVAGTLVFVRVLHEVENQVVRAMGIDPAKNPGGVTAALWESGPFREIVTHLVGDRETAGDILRIPPLALFYGWMSFAFAPLLVILVSTPRIAEEIWSGSIRFAMFRTSRLAWCSGKVTGQACQLLAALLLSAAGAWLVGWLRMDRYPALPTALYMAIYAMKAWVFALAFLGLATGISQMCSNPHTATAVGFIALAAVSVLGAVAPLLARQQKPWAPAWDLVLLFLPAGHKLDLWRGDPAHLVPASVFLLALGAAYMLAGHARFSRRDL
jgi:ABC-type transport system involved in multi-copper enzyme maturation permease subunit